MVSFLPKARSQRCSGAEDVFVLIPVREGAGSVNRKGEEKTYEKTMDSTAYCHVHECELPDGMYG
jgi:hypothetical protein